MTSIRGFVVAIIVGATQVEAQAQVGTDIGRALCRGAGLEPPAFIRDPTTGRRVSRPNSEAKWIRTEVPALRIVDHDLWQEVKARQAVLAKQFEPTTIAVRESRARTMHSLRRPAFLLSGLLICGCCGGKYGIMAAGRYGCLAHFRRGRCDNSRTIKRERIEKRVLAGLTEKLVSPEAVAEAVRS